MTSTVVVRRSTSCQQEKRVQNPDFRNTVSMDENVKSKLRPIESPKGYLSNTKEISDGMLTNVKGVNGGLGWLASTGRPDMAAPHSIIPSGYDRRSPQLISEVNPSPSRSGLFLSRSCVGRHSQTQASTQESDSDTNKVATNKYFNQERSAPVSVLHWRSRSSDEKR